MTDPTETNVNAPAALDGAGRLMRIGADFDTKWTEIQSRIAALNGATPWGTDEVGVEFAKSYLPPEDTQGATGVLTGITNLSGALRELGPQIIHAVNGTVDTDDETGQALTPE